MVEEVNRQLAEMHDLDFVPSPYSAAYMDWGDDPYGGGWNSWNIGVQAESVSRAIVQPEAEEPVYICGEAYSHYQGWVEGALATAEDMLQNRFGVPSPSWYKPDWEQPEEWKKEAETLKQNVAKPCQADGIPRGA